MSGLSRRERASIVAVLSAMAMVVLDAGLINVALPSIAQSLRIAPAQAILAVTAYQTALVMGLLPCAYFADRFGASGLFTGGLLFFTVASILCAFSSNLWWLIAARSAQGLGGAAIMALGIALLRTALGSEWLGRAIGWNALTVAVCAAAGPIIGAGVVSLAPWPWLFLIKLPVSAVALVAATALPRAKTQRQPIDLASVGLHVFVCLLLVLAAQRAVEHPGHALLLLGFAAALGTVLVRRVISSEGPLWPVDLLAVRPFRVSVIASLCCFTAQSAGLLTLPFYLQLSLGRSPLVTGLVLTCWPLTVAATSMMASRLAERIGSPALCCAGGLLLAAGLLVTAVPVAAGLISISIGAALSGLGFGLFQVPNNRTLFLSVPSHRSAAAGGMQGTARLTGQTAGALLIGSLFAAVSATTASRLGFAMGSLFALGAALVSALELPLVLPRRLAHLQASPDVLVER